MRSSNNHGVRSSTTKYKLKRIWRSTVMVFAAIVVFVTTYAMIIPAITWERTLICPLEAHVHTDFCYNSKGELKCGKEEHRHTDACFDAAPADPKLYFCGQTAHVHDENCYFEDGTLKCTLQEHKHTSDCEVSHRIVLPYFMAGSPLPELPAIKHYVDPSTKNTLDAKFRVDGEYTPDNDGKVVADKTVEWNGDTEQSFKVTLSALGQSYQEMVDVTEMMHPDVLFVVDMSTSTYRNFMKNDDGTNSSYTILEGIQSALNTSIATLLEKDPLTRIGIVSYNASSDYDLKLPMGYYLPLTGTDKEYVKLWKGTSTNRSSYSLYFNSAFQKATFAGLTVDGEPILTANGYVNSDGSNTRYTTSRGTYTQGGLYTGESVFTNLFNGMSDLERSKRAPAMILITDGEPTEYTRNWKTPETDSSITDNTGSRPGYFTVMTAVGVKARLTDLYDDYGNTFRLYTVGPGVVTKYGRSVLDPFGYSEDLDPVTGEKLTNLESCEGDTGSSSGNYPGDGLYNDMMNGFTAGGNSYLPYEQELAGQGYSANYADYADWSMSGALTIEKLNKGMQKIIDDITAIPRPILVSSHSTAPVSMIDPESYVEFTDVLGDGMTVVGAPTLYYNGDTFKGKLISEGTVSDDSDLRFRGWEYTLYGFTGKVTEESTNHTVDLAEVRAYVLKDPDTGKRAVEWLFPAEHLPIIFHDWRAKGEEPKFRTVQPIRLAFDVKTIKGLEPGYWYYSNSTDEITTCTFEVEPANPYKDEFGGKEIKSANNTETDENVSVYSKSDDIVTVTLGNNGKIFLDNFDLYVKKVWADSKNHSSDSVTVRLYRNNSYTGKSVTLNNANSWMGVFEDLDAYSSSGSLYNYSVREDALTGTYASYITGYNENKEFKYHREWTEDVYTYTYSWQNIWNLNGTSGNDFNTTDVYRLRINNTDTTLTNNNGSLSLTDIISTNPQISGTYTKQQWKFEKIGSNWYLKSVYDGKYIAVSSGSVVLSDSTKATVDRNNMQYSGIMTLNGSNVTSGGNTLVFRVEKLVIDEDVDHIPKEEEMDVRGTEVINSPPVDVTIKKTDEYGNVIAASGVKFGLYYDKECTEKVGTGEYLTDSTGKAIFEDLYIGGVYYVKELTAPEGYLKAPDVQKFEVLAEDNIKVETGQTYLSKDGTGKSLVMKMKNIRLYDLPATGGIGIYPIVMIGFCLTAVPLIYALYVLIQRRKRERRQIE